jgi:hypothetical protein
LAARARPRAARTRLFGFIAKPNGALHAHPSTFAASLLLIRPPKTFTIYRTWAAHVKAFFDPIGVKINVQYIPVRPYVLTFFCFILFYIMSPAPTIAAADPYGVINDIKRKPREMSQFGKKSAKVYHCLYSLLMQLQVAL